VIAVDASVLVRLVVGDDPGQARRARRLFERGDVLVTATVLLESAWVLASAYRLEPRRISAALRGVLGLEGVVTDSPAAIAKALDGYDAGLEFADALHVAGAARSKAFATFDERLVRRAKRAGIESVVTVPR
jgi:predicted nucleic acid-binding protein